MCIDFTNLNDACPKDSYPTPPIKRLVDSTTRHARLSFLDAYNGYHQTRVDPKDEEKIAFTIDVETYFYTRMPFGLNNTGATYQRVMDRAFEEQIERNVKVYVDDIIIKSEKDMNLILNVAKVFT